MSWLGGEGIWMEAKCQINDLQHTDINCVHNQTFYYYKYRTYRTQGHRKVKTEENVFFHKTDKSDPNILKTKCKRLIYLHIISQNIKGSNKDIYS